MRLDQLSAIRSNRQSTGRLLQAGAGETRVPDVFLLENFAHRLAVRSWRLGAPGEQLPALDVCSGLVGQLRAGRNVVRLRRTCLRPVFFLRRAFLLRAFLLRAFWLGFGLRVFWLKLAPCRRAGYQQSTRHTQQPSHRTLHPPSDRAHDSADALNQRELAGLALLQPVNRARRAAARPGPCQRPTGAWHNRASPAHKRRAAPVASAATAEYHAGSDRMP